MDDMERYEADRQENAVNERWQDAEDLGYSHGTCRIHGGFWTDSGDGCPNCEPEPDPEETQEDMGDWMQLMLANWNLRMERERQKMLLAARETKDNPGMFFFDALRRNGIFKGIL